MSFKKKPTIVEREIGGLPLSIETGWIAKQASGSVIVRHGENVVFDAVVLGEPRGDFDFFPMTVDYRERTSAVGRYPGGFFKREGRPTHKETLTMRLTDRPIRPMFPDWYKAEVLLQGVVYSSDGELDPDVLNIIGASAALCVSPAPFLGPIGAVRIGLVDDEFIPFPTYEERAQGDLDLVVTGTKDSITMVECGANQVPEEQMVEALEYAHEIIIELCEMQEELAKKVNAAERKVTEPTSEVPAEVASLVDKTKQYESAMADALTVRDKHERKAAVKAVKKKAVAELVGSDEDVKDLKESAAFNQRNKAVRDALEKMVKATMRKMILDKELRVDGRGLNDIRDIDIELGVLPRAHGSALFTRGETQVLATTTLGTKDDEQMVEGLKETQYERFMLHYSFPPFSVNEIKRVMGPGRREIGHGALAQRALHPLVPDYDNFPYTVRITADTLESNGSSSMASVCGGSLSMHQAGVPMADHVAGIAMGLVSDGKRAKVLSDILGDEDAIGDMDFKVCGTEEGITALQMDVKLEEGLKREVMAQALEQAREGRLHILAKMREAIAKPGKLSRYALKVRIVSINKEFIGKVIGAGGKMIRSIEETTQCKVDIEETGRIRVYGPTEEAVEKAAQFIRSITEEPEVGKIYKGRVVSTKDFGAFIEILPGTEGMCHISELSADYVERVSDHVKVGDELEVKVILVDDGGRVKLSHRAVLAEREGEEYAPNLPGGGSGGGGNGRGRGGRGDRSERAPRVGSRDRNDRGPRGERDSDRSDRGPRGERDSDRDRPRGGGSDRERDGDDARGPRRRRRGRSSAVSGDGPHDGGASGSGRAPRSRP